jgi:predicted dehydrogenase
MRDGIGIGVIGMGWMGEVHSRSYRVLPDRFPGGATPRLVVCADPIEARADAAERRFGFERSTTDWRDVIADPAVDVVNIAAPNALHRVLSLAAIAAGKRVFCEKPVGRFPQDTVDIAAAARATGALSFVGYNYRWAPVVQYALGLLHEGRLGTVTHYRGRFLNGYAGDPNGVLSWRFEADQGLGTLGDLMVHAIDMALMLAGPIDRLVADQETFIRSRPLPSGTGTHYDIGGADSQRGDVTNEDYVSALVHFASGARGVIESCRVITGARCDMSFEIHGTRGAMRWTFERMNELQVQWRQDDEPAQEGWTTVLSGPAHPYHRHFNPGWGVGLGYDDLKVIEAHEFLRSVEAGEQGAPGFAEALAVARVQQAIMRSWDSGAWEAVEGDG